MVTATTGLVGNRDTRRDAAGSCSGTLLAEAVPGTRTEAAAGYKMSPVCTNDQSSALLGAPNIPAHCRGCEGRFHSAPWTLSSHHTHAAQCRVVTQPVLTRGNDVVVGWDDEEWDQL